MSIATASDLEIISPLPLLKPLACAAACVALADWLFYRWPIGISLALFLGALGIVAVLSNRAHAPRQIRIAMGVVLAAVLIALIEDVNFLSSMLAMLGTGLFVVVVTTREPASWQRYLLEVLAAPFRGPFHLTADLIRAMQRGNCAWLKLDSLVGWIVPLGIFAIFVWLFASANPLIEHGLLKIDLRTLANFLNPGRVLFWILLAGVIWPLILRRRQPKSIRQADVGADVAGTPSEPGPPSDLDFLLGEKATLRSLILFNGLFALQTGLDLTYLWGGVNLPDGMSHAEYAHRGAYPLVATALLAAGFVLIAMRPGGPAQHSRLIRPLVLAWTAQNILLVISAIFRLDLYVATFSLTYLRLAAFIWMLLVAIGLLLILIQIWRKQSNSWLVSANAASLALVLYGCCFINAPRLVASYNVEHSREIGGTGPNLDLNYLASLGPQAEPALWPHVKEMPALQSVIYQCRYRNNSFQSGNWRQWSFRAWRLQQYLANNPGTPFDLSNSDKG
jgi:Domain of unknown function (DUF4173)